MLMAFEILGAIVFAAVGVLLLFAPNVAGARISAFYSRYPLVRHAGATQFKLRPTFVRALGIVILALALLAVWVLASR